MAIFRSVVQRLILYAFEERGRIRYVRYIRFIVMAGWDSSLIVASMIDKNIKPLIFLSVSMEDYEFNNS